MSGFFGSVLNDRTGKFNRQDDFASLAINEGNASYDFEDTYDGLGDQLEETGDDMNDDTFGGTDIGKDFDFSGKTATAAESLEEEQLTFQRRQPYAHAQEIDRSISRRPQPTASTNITSPWGVSNQIPSQNDIWGRPIQSTHQPQRIPEPQNYASKQTPRSAPQPPQVRKFQTLAEVEAAMLASSKPAVLALPANSHAGFTSAEPIESQQSTYTTVPPGAVGLPGYAYNQTRGPVTGSQPLRQYPPGMHPGPQGHPVSVYPSADQQRGSAMHAPQVSTVHAQSQAAPVRRPDIKALTVEDEEAIRIQQQKNLRRAQKIGQMARYNGLMSNGDKNYVLKVQISQLVSEDPEADDFYYTVHSTLRGRTNIQQSLGHFEQTYLSRVGQSGRRGNRDKQNPMLKMQQQVQKIIASAKSRPKSTSLAMEGSLGKLSFSRVRQPRQVLNVKMPENSGTLQKQSKKEALQSIETVYNTLLLLEHTGRQTPPEPADPTEQRVWEEKMDSLSEEIWTSLHVMDNVDNSQLHPFIQLLQYAKGKKLIPRIYRTLNPERRLTLVTMIVAHLDMLDVVQQARYDEHGVLPKDVREEIDLFTHTVLPPLLIFASNASMKIVVGLLNMLLDRNHINSICTSKVGLSFLTMFVSRAEIIKQANQADNAESEAWHSLYNRMFSMLEGKFGYIFPPVSHQVDEIYPWQFLAACAVSASPEQQHSLVNEARDRVLDNVQATKNLPQELADIKRNNVNLFLNAIGLDASQLEA